MTHLYLMHEVSSTSSGEALLGSPLAGGILDRIFWLASGSGRIFRDAPMDAGSHADIERRRASTWNNDSNWTAIRLLICMGTSRCAAVVAGQVRECLSLPTGFTSNLRHSLLIVSVRYPWRYKKVLRTWVIWHFIGAPNYRGSHNIHCHTSCPRSLRKCSTISSYFSLPPSMF